VTLLTPLLPYFYEIRPVNFFKDYRGNKIAKFRLACGGRSRLSRFSSRAGRADGIWGIAAAMPYRFGSPSISAALRLGGEPLPVRPQQKE